MMSGYPLCRDRNLVHSRSGGRGIGLLGSPLLIESISPRLTLKPARCEQA